MKRPIVMTAGAAVLVLLTVVVVVATRDPSPGGGNRSTGSTDSGLPGEAGPKSAAGGARGPGSDTTASASAPPEATGPDGIPTDCSADVTAALNAWVASHPSGATVALRPGCYLAESTVFIRQPLTLVADDVILRAVTDGAGAAIPPEAKEVNWPATRRHLAIGASNVTVRGLRIEGPNADAEYSRLEFQAGVHIQQGVRHVAVEDVTVTNVHGDCVQLGMPAGPEDVAIRGLRCDGSGRVGVSISAGRDVVLEHSTLRRIARSAIDIEPQTTAVVSGVTIRDNVIEAPGGPVLSIAGTGELVEHVTFADNRIVGRGLWMKIGSPSRATLDVVITDNASDSEGHQDAISVGDVDGLTVVGNVNRVGPEQCSKDSCSGGVWLVLRHVSGAHIDGNDGGQGIVKVDDS